MQRTQRDAKLGGDRRGGEVRFREPLVQRTHQLLAQVAVAGRVPGPFTQRQFQERGDVIRKLPACERELVAVVDVEAGDRRAQGAGPPATGKVTGCKKTRR